MISIPLSSFLQCDFQVIYASGIKGKAGLSPENLGDDLGPLFEAVVRCIPGPKINKDGALQMLVSCFFTPYVSTFFLFYIAYDIAASPRIFDAVNCLYFL